MKRDWIDNCMVLAATPADFYSGARKIIQNVHFTFNRLQDSLVMADCGFTKSKMSMLTRNYLHEESRAAAVKLWDRRMEQDKYGSVGFTTYNHFMKGDVQGATKRGSVMGPCIQSVTLTYLDKKPRATQLDVFYRTTELFKKFPADLVFLRDVLLEPFDFAPAPIQRINFHFANVTCHPMYFVTIIPHLSRPMNELDLIRKKDPHFFDWTVKWTARYLVPEYFRGIQKFAQAMRVRQDALDRIPSALKKDLVRYLKKHHPGYRNEYTPPEDEEE